MSSIGAQTFARMDGLVDVAELQMEDITRRNVAGIAFWLTGFRGQPFQLVTTSLLSSLWAVETAVRTYKGMTGGTYTVTDDLGNAYPNIMVLPGGRPMKHGSLTTPTNGSSVAYLIYQWNLIDTSTS